MPACEHFEDLAITSSETRVCADCVALESSWVHLRLCTMCGYVGCCDSSPNRHASKHAATTEHPVIRSLEPGETWAYCYIDDLFADDLPA